MQQVGSRFWEPSAILTNTFSLHTDVLSLKFRIKSWSGLTPTIVQSLIPRHVSSWQRPTPELLTEVVGQTSTVPGVDGSQLPEGMDLH